MLSRLKSIKNYKGIGSDVTKSTYASLAGRSKMLNEQDTFTKKELKHLINNHVQLITDFNLIYEDPVLIQIYQIGTLFTKPIKGSYTVSQTKNYVLEEKTQEVKFFKNPMPIKYDLYFVRKSKKYFSQKEVREQIEQTQEYKELYNKVVEELKLKNIKVRLAMSQDEEMLTGLEVLTNKEVTNNEKLFEKIAIQNDEKL